MAGILHDRAKLFLREDIGKAEDQNRNLYEMALGNGFIPMVRSAKTGKFFELPWEEIIDMAKDAGIDNP